MVPPSAYTCSKHLTMAGRMKPHMNPRMHDWFTHAPAIALCLNFTTWLQANQHHDYTTPLTYPSLTQYDQQWDPLGCHT